MFNAMACAMQLRDLILNHGFGQEVTENYSIQIENIWKYYLGHKDLFYRQEQRWKQSEFWKRRQ